jgi:hypothetical protein
MNESIKATLGFITAICVMGGFMFWGTDPPSHEVWAMRIVFPMVGVACILVLVWAQTRKDKAPDFLARMTRRYFERDGFCFCLAPKANAGQCEMHVFFQNRYERACSAQILVRSTSTFSGAKADLPEIQFGVSCGPAEFGHATLPWAISPRVAGKTVSLSVYAGVKYPDGRGALLRYRDGIRVGAMGMDFWREGLQIAGAMVGNLVISRPARVKFTLPSMLPAPAGPPMLPGATGQAAGIERKTLWKLGDPLPA